MSDSLKRATTLHLIAAGDWDRVSGDAFYTPDAFAADGFVHCTDGDDNLVAVGNRYYRADCRPFLALTISLDRLTAPFQYDDPARIFPHIYGPLNRDAVVGRRSVLRGPDGSFIAIADNETPL